MKKISLYIFSIFLSLLTFSCSDLKEEVFSDTVADKFFSNADEITGSYVKAFAHYNWSYSWSHYAVSVLAADQLVWTVKEDQHGIDGGVWEELHRHSWTPQHDLLIGSWENTFKGIAYCNDFINNVQNLDISAMELPVSKEEMLAQVKAMRAFYYYKACDYWGNVPISLGVGDVQFPGNNSRSEVYKFIEDELIEAIQGLPVKSGMDQAGYFTKSTAYALLSRIYINSEVYGGVKDYQKCVDACNEIEKLGNYTLDAKSLDTFGPENDNSNENMFFGYNDGVTVRTYFTPIMFSLHPALQVDWEANAWVYNGIVAMEGFYDSFNADDARRNQLLEGLQYSRVTGDPLMHGGEQVNFPKHITAFWSPTLHEGARINKYVIEQGFNQEYPTNNYVHIRYTEVVLNKAEALMRLNGGTATQEAVDLVNQIRQRAFGENYEANKYTTATLTMDELLAERGREFVQEGLRRPDLIRFGKFNNAWWEKDASEDTYRTLFPIPHDQIQVNANLKQNPGY